MSTASSSSSADVDRAQLAARGGGQAGDQPGGSGVRPDDARERARRAGRVGPQFSRAHRASRRRRRGPGCRRRCAAWSRPPRPRRAPSRGELAEQERHARAATVRGPVALARGVQSRARAGRRSRPRAPSRAGSACRSAAPPQRKRLVVLDERAGREDLAVVAAVDDLVRVRERDVRRARRPRRSGRRPARRRRAAVAVGEDRAAGHAMGDRGRLEDRWSRAVSGVATAGDLDDAGAVRRPLTTGPP